jgi:Flp pilus assembly protein TadG
MGIAEVRVGHSRWRDEAGQVFVVFALVLPVMLGVSAIVADVGGLFVQKRALQSAADAAALAAANDLVTDSSCTDSCISGVTRTYSGLNTGPAALADLQKCPGDGSCYTWPYVDPVTHVADPNRVEVKLKRSVPTLLARVFHISQVTVSARAVAGISPGTPPPYSFVSLNASDKNHTLLVKLGGQLTVTNNIYVNSSNLDNGSTSLGDAFDIFGLRGNISAPGIFVHGGWETHDNDTVTVNNILCVAYTKTTTADKLDFEAIDAMQTTFGLNKTALKPDEYIQIDDERMHVLTVVKGNPDQVTVTRGDLDTVAAPHALSTPAQKTLIYLVVPQFSGVTGPGCPTTSQSVLPDPFDGKITKPTLGSPAGCPDTPAGTATTPRACGVASGSVTLHPGTYYGGICIGGLNGTGCKSACSQGTAQVTLLPGTYVMAGGGFWVCGSSELSAPNVMIYNTKDPSSNAASGQINQVKLNTSGRVSLGPQTSGPYQGLTVFQDPLLGLGNSCDRNPEDADISLTQMGGRPEDPANKLGSISGTVYAHDEWATFADSVSGTANLAVLTGCIFIDAGNSTFDFHGSGLFGIGSGLSE